MSQNRGYPQWYISTPAWRSDPPFHMRSTGSPRETPMPLALKDLHATRRGDNPNWVHNCQNWQNRPHSLWASTLTKVAPLRPRGVRTMGTNIHNTHVIYGPWVHASGVHEGADHGAWRAENAENCSKWPKMRTLMVGANEAHARLGPECAIGLVSSHMRPTYLLGIAQTPPVLGMAGSPSEPMIWDRPKSPTWRPRYAKPKRSYSLGPRYVGHRSMYPHNIFGS